MNRSPNRGDVADSVRSRLKAGDPLGHESAGAEEERSLARLSARLDAHARVLDAAPAASRPRWLAPLAATAVLFVTAWLGVRWVEAPAREAVADPRPSARPSGGAVAEPEIRQVQFQTSGGTRVVWVLDPRFAL
jgi:hypothetical protein